MFESSFRKSLRHKIYNSNHVITTEALLNIICSILDKDGDSATKYTEEYLDKIEFNTEQILIVSPTTEVNNE